MKKLILPLLILTMNLIATDEEGACQRCKVIREYNKAHPENNFYWYDDYLEKQNEDKGTNEEEKTSKTFNQTKKLNEPSE